MTTAQGKDLETRLAVEEELAHEARVDAAALGVAVHDGVVVLSGHVPFLVQRAAAETAARRVKGVRAVAQEIEVRPPSEAIVADEAIAARAAEMLNWTAPPGGQGVEISVSRGVVTLSGEVVWRHQRQDAEHLVRALAGVRDVRNNLVVHPDIAPEAVAKVLGRAFHRNAELERDNIQVQVDGSVVTLSGKAQTWRGQDVAEQAAWSTPGVTQVVNNIQIGV